MIPAEQIYTVAVTEIASLNQRMERLVTRYEALPETAFADGYRADEEKKKAVQKVKALLNDGDLTTRAELVKSTAYYHHNDYQADKEEGSNGSVMRSGHLESYAQKIDKLVRQDVENPIRKLTFNDR